MRISELLESISIDKSIVYVDMDGVIANFEGLVVENNNNYFPPEDEMRKIVNGYGVKQFFTDLKPFPSTFQLLKIVIDAVGSYSICSSPWRDNQQQCIEGKILWINEYLKDIPPKNIIFERTKSKHATTNGTQHILIDDFEEQTDPWNAAGGIGITYIAAKNNPDIVQKRLQQIFSGHGSRLIS